MRREKGGLQGDGAFVGYAGRRREWSRHGEERCFGKLDQPARGSIGRKFVRGRNLGQLRVTRAPRKLQQDVETAGGLEPLRPIRLDRRKVEGPPVHLAALDS